jgi:hypothetical protein
MHHNDDVRAAVERMNIVRVFVNDG